MASLCRQEPKSQGVPTSPPLQLVSSFCCFLTTVYMQPGSLFISWERRSWPSCALPLCSVYQLGLCLSTTLPLRPASQGEFLAPSHDTRLTIVCGVVYSSHSGLLLSIIIKRNQIIPQDRDLGFPYFSLLPSCSWYFPSHIHHNRRTLLVGDGSFNAHAVYYCVCVLP